MYEILDKQCSGRIIPRYISSLNCSTVVHISQLECTFQGSRNKTVCSCKMFLNIYVESKWGVTVVQHKVLGSEVKRNYC